MVAHAVCKYYALAVSTCLYLYSVKPENLIRIRKGGCLGCCAVCKYYALTGYLFMFCKTNHIRIRIGGYLGCWWRLEVLCIASKVHEIGATVQYRRWALTIEVPTFRYFSSMGLFGIGLILVSD